MMTKVIILKSSAGRGGSWSPHCCCTPIEMQGFGFGFFFSIAFIETKQRLCASPIMICTQYSITAPHVTNICSLAVVHPSCSDLYFKAGSSICFMVAPGQSFAAVSIALELKLETKG